MRLYGNGWKRQTLYALELTGSDRAIFCALMQLSDWMGRSQIDLDKLALASGMSRATVKRHLPPLIASGIIRVLQAGEGRRPTFYQVAHVGFSESVAGSSI